MQTSTRKLIVRPEKVICTDESSLSYVIITNRMFHFISHGKVKRDNNVIRTFSS